MPGTGSRGYPTFERPAVHSIQFTGANICFLRPNHGPTMIRIRPELPEDPLAVRALNEAAFGQSAEADIVDALRVACPDALSLVAVSDAAIVGHIFFSPVTVEGSALAPRVTVQSPSSNPLSRNGRGLGRGVKKGGGLNGYPQGAWGWPPWPCYPNINVGLSDPNW
jgi:hypothetical protein